MREPAHVDRIPGKHPVQVVVEPRTTSNAGPQAWLGIGTGTNNFRILRSGEPKFPRSDRRTVPVQQSVNESLDPPVHFALAQTEELHRLGPPGQTLLRPP